MLEITVITMTRPRFHALQGLSRRTDRDSLTPAGQRVVRRFTVASFDGIWAVCV